MKDLDEVREALRHERINLWGVPYGSLEALEYVRRHPGRVRALTIQGVAPPALFGSISIGRSTQRALDATVEAFCSEDIDRFTEEEIREAAESTFLGPSLAINLKRSCEGWPRGALPDDFHRHVVLPEAGHFLEPPLNRRERP